VCPTVALKALKNGGVKLYPDKCIGCGNCADGCTLGAIFWNHERNKPVICVYCGYCTNYCPHGVLGFDKTKVEGGGEA
jgi:Fe-S-cluster-containing hydrogenase component 2